MKKVLSWVRANLLIVIFGALALLAVIGLPLVAKSRNEYVSAEMAKRVQALRDLESLERTQVTLTVGGLGDQPATTIDQRAVVNAALLSQLRSVSERQSRDAEGIFAAAEQFNRGDHQVLMPELFPEPRIGPALWGLRFHRLMEQAYERLLRDVRAAMPPNEELLVADIERRRRQFMTATLQKDDADDLTSEELARLTEALAQTRVALLARAAEDIAFYFPPNLVPLPAFEQARTYTLDELFRWQWEYWLVSDVMNALASANRAGGNVIRGPVKRVVAIQPMVSFSGSAAAGSPAGGGGGPGFGFGDAGGGDGPTGAGAAGATGAAPNPDTPIQPDYRSRFTGRSSNNLYDVFDVRLELVVDTALIPQVLNAFAQQNFMTVVDFRMRPDDPVDAIRRGFVYGSAPVSRLEILLETVWFRTWTASLMPEPVRNALGVGVPGAVDAAPEEEQF